MGLPALSLSQQLMDNIENILVSVGIRVQRKDLSIKDVPTAKMLPYEYECTSNKGDVVILRFSYDEGKHKDHVLVAMYSVRSKSWKLWRKNPLEQSIEKALLENGAEDISHFFNEDRDSP